MAISKKVFIVLFVILLAGGSLLAWYAYLQRNTKTPGGSPVSGLLDFFPFGRGGETTTTGGGAEDGEGTEGVEGGEEAPLNRLRLVAASPVAGATTREDSATKETLIRYVDRATGHIFETSALRAATRRVTNTTIPRLQEALFVENGEGVLLRYLKDDTETIVTFYGKVTPRTLTEGSVSEIEAELKGFFLPENIRHLAVSPDTKKIFFLTERSRGATGSVANPDGTRKTDIFSSPATEWIVSWPEQKKLLMSTKPAFDVFGYAYLLDADSGALGSIVRKLPALTVLAHPSLQSVLLSQGGQETATALKLLTVPTGIISELRVETLPEKCVWSSANKDVLYCAVPRGGMRGEYPDLWYKGITSFSDDVWKINTTTGEADVFFDLEEEAQGSIDVLHPFLDAKEAFLFFTNKNDLSFWSLRLKE